MRLSPCETGFVWKNPLQFYPAGLIRINPHTKSQKNPLEATGEDFSTIVRLLYKPCHQAYQALVFFCNFQAFQRNPVEMLLVLKFWFLSANNSFSKIGFCLYSISFKNWKGKYICAKLFYLINYWNWWVFLLKVCSKVL